MTTTFDAKAAAAEAMANASSANGQHAPDGRVRLEITNAALMADWLRNELGKGQLAGIFRRDGQLVHTPRMGEEGYLPAEKLGVKDAGPAQVRPISVKEIKALIEVRYLCWRLVVPNAGKENEQREQVQTMFPFSAVESAYNAATLGEKVPNLRTLHGVTHTLTIRSDGTILDQPGYDDASGLLYLPDDSVRWPTIPDNPTPDDLADAWELILEPLAEFPWCSAHDKATWIGLAFTPALRPLLPPPYQMGVITATNSGSGKTLLAKMLTILQGGVTRGEMPREKDEFRKAITATLVGTTAPIVVFDNLRGVVRNAELEALLTSDTWTDRWLGANTQVTAANNRLWIATGNNCQFGGDLGRRIVVASLDPPETGHHLKTDFQIRDLEAWMHANRGKYLAAILTVTRAWIQAGRPTQKARGDSYAAWTEGIRGILATGFIDGTFGGSDSDIATTTSDDDEWEEFLVALSGARLPLEFTVKNIAKALKVHHDKSTEWTSNPLDEGLDPAKLPGDLSKQWEMCQRSDRGDGSFRRSLGAWLRSHAGRWTPDGWKLVRAPDDSVTKAAKYTVQAPARHAPQLRG